MVGLFKSRTFPVSTTFQPTIPTPVSTLQMVASKIVAASALALGNDHDATVEIVAQGLSKFTAAEVDTFVTRGSDPAIATQIVYAALEPEAADVGDEVPVGPSALVTPVLASDAADFDLGATPVTAMLSMIKQIMLPMAERMVAEQVTMSTRLAHLEASMAALSA